MFLVPHGSFTWNEIMDELSELYELLSAGEMLDVNRCDAPNGAKMGLPPGTRTGVDEGQCVSIK